MGRVLVQQPGTNTAKALTETLPKNVIIVDEDLKELRLHDGVTPGGKIIGQSAGSGVPIGTIIPFAGNSVPQGYLLCDGSAISRTDYASLFAVIGTIYGAGDGNSTFNLPNLADGKTLKGTTSSQYHSLIHTGGLPEIQGWINLTQNQVEATGDGNAFYRTNPGAVYVHVNQTTTEGRTVGFLASRSNNVYGRTSNTVEPYGYWMYHLIKYI